MNNSRIYIPELSTMRFLFILMIFFHHVDLFPGGGATGVSFFFILGGFTLTLGYSELVLEIDFDYRKYLTKRLIKFFPLHWLILFLFVPLNYLCGVTVSLKTFVPNFLLIQSFIPVKDFFYSYNSPSWYLCNTVFFTFVFPFIYRIFSKMKGKQWFGVVLLFAVVIIAQWITPKQYCLSILYINPCIRLFDFVLGVLIAMGFLKLIQNDIQMNYLKNKSVLVKVVMIVSLSLVIIIPALVSNLSGKAYLLWLPIVALILSAAILSLTDKSCLLKNSFLVNLGGVSFSFYMIHSLVINLIQVISFKAGVANPCIVVPVTLVLTIAGSYGVTYLFVNPVTKWLNSKLIK